MHCFVGVIPLPDGENSPCKDFYCQNWSFEAAHKPLLVTFDSAPTQTDLLSMFTSSLPQQKPSATCSPLKASAEKQKQNSCCEVRSVSVQKEKGWEEKTKQTAVWTALEFRREKFSPPFSCNKWRLRVKQLCLPKPCLKILRFIDWFQLY